MLIATVISNAFMNEWVKVIQSCPILADHMECSMPGSSVHEILQVRILESVAIPFSKGSFQPRDQTQVSHIANRYFTVWATREAPKSWNGLPLPYPGDLPDLGIEPGSPALQADSSPVELPRKPKCFQRNILVYIWFKEVF